MDDNIKNGIELIFITIWTYGGGYLFAWLLPLDIDPVRTAAIFGSVGFVLGAYSIERRRYTGRFPVMLSIIILAIPFTCSVIALWLYILRWLGLIADLRGIDTGEK